MGRSCYAWRYDYQSWPGGISVLCDADWASEQLDRRSVDCTHVILGGHLLETPPSRQQIESLSSAESEFCGITRAAAAGLQIRELLAGVSMPSRLQVFSDSSAARGIVSRSGSGRAKHIETRYLCMPAAANGRVRGHRTTRATSGPSSTHRRGTRSCCACCRWRSASSRRGRFRV